MEKVSAKQELKKQLLEECLKIQNQLVKNAKDAMELAQESANEEKGKMGDKFESFREQCQIDRDMFAKQYQEAMALLNILHKINVDKENEMILPGSVVVTDVQNIFVAVSIGNIKMSGKDFFAVSTLSPIYKAMTGKRKGDSFSFRDKIYKITDTF
jgi:transcription elongation GreA/GreB family factor